MTATAGNTSRVLRVRFFFALSLAVLGIVAGLVLAWKKAERAQRDASGIVGLVEDLQFNHPSAREKIVGIGKPAVPILIKALRKSGPPSWVKI